MILRALRLPVLAEAATIRDVRLTPTRFGLCSSGILTSISLCYAVVGTTGSLLVNVLTSTGRYTGLESIMILISGDLQSTRWCAAFNLVDPARVPSYSNVLSGRLFHNFWSAAGPRDLPDEDHAALRAGSECHSTCARWPLNAGTCAFRRRLRSWGTGFLTACSCCTDASGIFSRPARILLI